MLFEFTGKKNEDFFVSASAETSSIAVVMVYFYAVAEAKKENFIPVNSKDKWYMAPSSSGGYERIALMEVMSAFGVKQKVDQVMRKIFSS